MCGSRVVTRGEMSSKINSAAGAQDIKEQTTNHTTTPNQPHNHTLTSQPHSQPATQPNKHTTN